MGFFPYFLEGLPPPHSLILLLQKKPHQTEVKYTGSSFTQTNLFSQIGVKLALFTDAAEIKGIDGIPIATKELPYIKMMRYILIRVLLLLLLHAVIRLWYALSLMIMDKNLVFTYSDVF